MQQGDNMRRLTLFVVFLSILALGYFSIKNLAEASGGFGPGHKEVTASSGVPHRVSKHWPFRTNPTAFSLKITKPPKHGSVKIQQSADITSVIYQSKPGFNGKDDFAYVRVGSDRFAGTYTVAVTVK